MKYFSHPKYHVENYVPRINFSKVARALGRGTKAAGEQQLEAILFASMDLRVPVPILTTPWFAMGGEVMPASTLVDDILGPMRVPLIQGGAGFSSLSDLIAEATTGGKRQDLIFAKTGVTGVVAMTNTLWYEGTVPPVGATAAALAGGTNHNSATVGAIGPQANAAGGDQLHLTTGFVQATVAPNCILLYDRIWAGTPAASTSGNQTVTHTLTRYVTAGTSPGNFAFMETVSALSNTAHTHTITYVDNAGNGAEASAAMTGINSCIAKRLDHSLGGWSIPLNAGDSGFQDITIYANSASVTGAQALVVGHPLAFMPVFLANRYEVMDGINSAFNLPRIYDDACLALLEVAKSATTATSYSGQLILVAG